MSEERVQVCVFSGFRALVRREAAEKVGAKDTLLAIDEHRDRITSETLADELGPGDAADGKELKILGSAVRLAVERV